MSFVLKTARSILRGYNQLHFKSFSYPKIQPPKYQSRSVSGYVDMKFPNNQAVDIEKYYISPDKKHLCISWNSDTTGINKYYALWLRHQCHCEECFQSSSGQNLVNPENLEPTILLEELGIKNNSISITWKYEDGRSHQGFISLHWLYKMKKMPDEKCDAKFILPELEFDEILSSEEGLYNYLSLINKHGVVKVVNAPGENGGLQFADRISFRMETFYGHEFDVWVIDDPINVAYSDLKLKHHIDLVYCNHAAGLQHLHCIRNDPCVSGGVLSLNDIYEIAENFRREYPDFFHTLSRVPVIFHHITFKRRTYMEVRSPTITLDHNNEISLIRWAPATQGPVIDTNDAPTLDAYFRASNQFQRYVESYPPKAKFFFKAGDIASFHNIRMVHGRSKIFLNGGTRHLKGCYTSIDEFQSKLRYLSVKLGRTTPTKIY